MGSISPSDKIYIKKSAIPGAGRGVFAARDIKKGEVIEMCPVIMLPKNDFANINESFLVTYFYSFGKDKDQLALALGFGSIYNHTYTPNATYKKLENDDVMEFIAIQNIKKDEEITVNYNNCDPNDKTPLWFE